jgi:2'-5' RNA ligase
MLSPDGDGQSGEQTLGQFALVSYIPDPLARFLDDLRVELTPGCNPRAHVTILPPRPLHNDVDVKDTIQLIVEECRNLPPFRVEPGDIRVFVKSNVVYLDIARGIDELREFYRVLNQGPLEYKESFPYHPHITIAQNIPPDQAPRLAAVAKEKWAGYRGPRGFTVSSLSFVQHVAPSIWTDVATIHAGVEVPVGQ